MERSPVLVMAVRRPGCSLCRHQATALSEIKDELDTKGIRLIGVVHETLGVDEFRPYLKDADIYYDSEVIFKLKI